MYRTSAMEGLGGPVSPHDDGRSSLPSPHDDPTLASCCAREIESNRKRSTLEATLRRHDRVALAERRRRHLLNLDFGSGCRCCYDPNADGGEYGALREARLDALEEERERARENGETYDGGGAGRKNDTNDDGDGDGPTAGGGGVDVAGGDDNKPRGGSDSDLDSDDDSEFDYLLDEDLPSNVTNEHEERRRLELEEIALYRESLSQHGYGVHRQHHPGRVLHVAGVGADPRGGGNNRGTAAVVHLYDPESEASARLDLLLERGDFAGKYPGTKFVRAGGRPTLLLNAEMAQTHLPGLRPEHGAAGDLPCLLAVVDGTVVARCPGLTGLVVEDHHGGGTVRVDARAVEQWLDHAGGGDVLRRDPPPYEDICRVRPEEDALLDSARLFSQPQEGKEESIFDCGVEGCEKAFRHEHVGIKNDRQDGLVVREDEQVLQEE